MKVDPEAAKVPFALSEERISTALLMPPSSSVRTRDLRATPCRRDARRQTQPAELLVAALQRYAELRTTEILRFRYRAPGTNALSAAESR